MQGFFDSIQGNGLPVALMECKSKVQIPERIGFIGNQIKPVSGQADESVIFRDGIRYIVCNMTPLPDRI